MKNLSSFVAAAALVVAAPFNAANAAFSQMINFGDSLSDTGNILIATGGAAPVAPNLPGRFSNGTTWNENLAADLGLAAPTASLGGGTNFAWGGSRTSLPGSSAQPSAQAQVGQYLASVGGVADPDALFTIMIGGNDLNAFDGVTYGAAELTADAALIATLTQDLLNAGAQNIIVSNVPDLSGAPIADGNEAATLFITDLFNNALAAAMAPLIGPNVAFLDAFAVSQAAVAGAPGNGFTNVDDACWDGVSATFCANPDEYLFWDALHPTGAGHETIGEAALAAALTLPSAVPVPAALPLFMTALAGFGAMRRLRK